MKRDSPHGSVMSPPPLQPWFVLLDLCSMMGRNSRHGLACQSNNTADLMSVSFSATVRQVQESCMGSVGWWTQEAGRRAFLEEDVMTNGKISQRVQRDIIVAGQLHKDVLLIPLWKATLSMVSFQPLPPMKMWNPCVKESNFSPASSLSMFNVWWYAKNQMCQAFFCFNFHNYGLQQKKKPISDY